jgi:hypothetical protein
MRQREAKKVRKLYAKPTAKLCRAGIRGCTPKLPAGVAEIISDFAAEQAMPQCVMDVLPLLEPRKYEVSCDAGKIRLKLRPYELGKLVGHRVQVTEMVNGPPAARNTVTVRKVEPGNNVLGQELVLDYPVAHPHLHGTPGERRVFSASLRSCWLVLEASERDRDYLRAWYSRYLRPWPRTGGRTILERFVLVPWCRGCELCGGGGCPRDVV